MTGLGFLPANDMADLNLLLIYLNAWEEDSRKKEGGIIIRAWKNYPFHILNELEKNKLIHQYPKSLIITREGLMKAEELLHRYFYPQRRD